MEKFPYRPRRKMGAVLTRAAPLHKGHMELIRAAQHQFGPQDTAVFLGSADTFDGRPPCTLREREEMMKTPFTKDQRGYTIRRSFGRIDVIPLPDFHDRNRWLAHIHGIAVERGWDLTFAGGAEEDLEGLKMGFPTQVLVNRHTGTSATRVRGLLAQAHSRDHKKGAQALEELHGLVSPGLIPVVLDYFLDSMTKILGPNWREEWK